MQFFIRDSNGGTKKQDSNSKYKKSLKILMESPVNTTDARSTCGRRRSNLPVISIDVWKELLDVGSLKFKKNEWKL